MLLFIYFQCASCKKETNNNEIRLFLNTKLLIQSIKVKILTLKLKFCVYKYSFVKSQDHAPTISATFLKLKFMFKLEWMHELKLNMCVCACVRAYIHTYIHHTQNFDKSFKNTILLSLLVAAHLHADGTQPTNTINLCNYVHIPLINLSSVTIR